MADTNDKPTREERLAAKLRDNLRRRKAQARSIEGSGKPALSQDPPLSKDGHKS